MEAELKKRPFLLLFCMMTLGILLKPFPIAFAGCAICVGFILNLFQKRPLLLAGLALGVYLAPNTHPQPSKKVFAGTLTIAANPIKTQQGTRYILKSLGNSFDSMHRRSHVLYNQEEKFLLYLKTNTPLYLGDQIYLKAQIKPLSMQKKQYWEKQGVAATLIPLEPFQRTEQGPTLWKLGAKIHASFSNFVNQWMEPAASHLIKAICFNDRSGISKSLQQALSNTGTSHILSTSGLHVFLVAGILTFFTKLLPIPHPARLGILALLLLFYIVAAGFGAPAIRAYIMFFLGATAYLFARTKDSLSSLAFAGIFCLLWNPAEIYSLGFQLSFLCSAGLILFMPALQPAKRETLLSYVARRSYQTSMVTLIATLASIPILLYTFGRISLLTIPANILIVPFLPILMVSTLLSWGLSFFAPASAIGFLKVIADPISGWILFVIESLGSPEWAVLKAPKIPFWSLPMIYGALLLLWNPKPKVSFLLDKIRTGNAKNDRI